MTAKMTKKKHHALRRPDWYAINVDAMRWCLEVKLAQNFDTFSKLLLSTGSGSIVEGSARDNFWGAKPSDDDKTLCGANELGRLLVKLPQKLRKPPRAVRKVKPLDWRSVSRFSIQWSFQVELAWTPAPLYLEPALLSSGGYILLLPSAHNADRTAGQQEVRNGKASKSLFVRLSRSVHSIHSDGPQGRSVPDWCQ